MRVEYLAILSSRATDFVLLSFGTICCLVNDSQDRNVRDIDSHAIGYRAHVGIPMLHFGGFIMCGFRASHIVYVVPIGGDESVANQSVI